MTRDDRSWLAKMRDVIHGMRIVCGDGEADALTARVNAADISHEMQAAYEALLVGDAALLDA